MKLIVVRNEVDPKRVRLSDDKYFGIEVVDEPIIVGKDDDRIPGSSTWLEIRNSNFKSSPLHGGWAQWVEYKFKNTVDVDKINKLEYAYFCAGYLFYYDEILRNGCRDHEIFFHWSNKAPKGLVIFINPPPCYFNEKPLYPNLHRKQDEDAQYYYKRDGDYLLPRGDGIDPQPPPPPPPPPQSP